MPADLMSDKGPVPWFVDGQLLTLVAWWQGRSFLLSWSACLPKSLPSGGWWILGGQTVNLPQSPNTLWFISVLWDVLRLPGDPACVCSCEIFRGPLKKRHWDIQLWITSNFQAQFERTLLFPFCLSVFSNFSPFFEIKKSVKQTRKRMPLLGMQCSVVYQQIEFFLKGRNEIFKTSDSENSSM